MSTITKDLGVVTAYGYYKAGGGTMTESEFTQFMVDFGTASKTATEAAQAALESENAARASEENATQKSTEASESASTASSKAREASQSASEADAAKDDAVSAQNAAEIAQRKAEDAQEATESVAESISSDYSQLSEDVSELKSQMDEKAPAIMQTVSDQVIASFADGADDMPLKSLTVAINPVQAGTGDPSPENVRPITGWTGAKVTRTGKNLADESAIFGTLKGWTSSDGVYTGETRYIHQAYGNGVPGLKFKPLTQYTVIVHYSGATSATGLVLFFTYTDGTYSTTNCNSTTPTDFQLTSSAGKTIEKMKLSYGNNVVASVSDFRLVEGSTATAYEPYQGNTYDVSWETEAGTVYGGALDVVSGVLTVNKVYAQLNNSDGWVEYSGPVANYQYTPRFNDRRFGSRAVAASSAFPVFALGLPLSIGWLNADNSPFIGIIDTGNVLTLSSLREMASNNAIAIVYELATPQTYQLTPVEVKTLLGQNNIFADTGSVTVVYPADTKTYIDNQIAALQALVLENISNS